MKPLLLELQAFGPFAANESIDFTALGSNPLFLINGATGAGKSTILDAICFALYGQTTGAEREASQMRCDFSEPLLLTEVSLTFSLGDKRYRVRRLPQQEKPKKHGEGTTNHVPESQLWELDGSEEGKLLVSKSVNEATQTIKGLIGLDVEQFRQVMVLPQGKFRELLLADSKDREKIFSQLFQTGIYKRIEDRLKQKASGIKQAVENHQNQVRGILQTAEVSTEEEVTEQLSELALALKDASKAKSTAEKDKKASEVAKDKAEQLSNRFEALSQKQQHLAEALKQEPAIKEQQRSLDRDLSAQKIQPVFTRNQNESDTLRKLQQNLESSNTAAKTAKQRHTDAEQTLALAKKAAAEVSELTKQLIELERLEKQIDALKQARLQRSAADATLLASQAALKNKQGEQKILNDELIDSEKSNQVLFRELETLGAQQVALQKLTTQLEQRKELETLHQQVIKQTEKQQQCQQQFTAMELAFSLAATSAKKAELSWHAGQAALLAKELKENEPCLVCGSEQHPAPASIDGARVLVSKGDVDQARAAEAGARKVMDSSKKALDQAINALAQTNKDCQRLEGQLEQLANEPLQTLSETTLRAQEGVTALLAKQGDQKKLQARIEAIKTDLLALKIALDALEKQASDNNEQAVKARAAVDLLLASVPEELRAAGALSKQLHSLKAQIAQLTETLNNAEEAQATARSESDKATAHYAAIEKQAKEQAEKTKLAASTWAADLKSSVFSSDEDFQSALLEENEQQSLKAMIETYRSELDALKGVIKQMQSDVADKVNPDLEGIEETLLEKNALYRQADEVWRKIEERNNQFKSVKKKLDQAHKTNEALEAEYKVIGTLSEVANGQTGNKISLQRFVLSVLLDDVLIQASQRLVQMSKGRYRLVRKEDRAKGNKASGLELEVDDGYSGKTRSVATLSGGESFLAALSLALGLSDVVQSYAGGIKLDTLFIDEGFGSLDPESLDLAVRTLIDLQASGRMIGIISHVSELKEQMALRVDVISDRSGSRIATCA